MTENAIIKPPKIHLYYTTYLQGNVLNFQGTCSIHLSGNSCNCAGSNTCSAIAIIFLPAFSGCITSSGVVTVRSIGKMQAFRPANICYVLFHRFSSISISCNIVPLRLSSSLSTHSTTNMSACLISSSISCILSRCAMLTCWKSRSRYGIM